jgi:hypothetical protein
VVLDYKDQNQYSRPAKSRSLLKHFQKLGKRSQYDDDDRGPGWMIGIVVLLLLVLMIILTFYWSQEPGMFDVEKRAQDRAKLQNETIVPGYITTHTLMEVARTLLDKPGGYLTNDVMPPSLFLDNIPSWEFGALVQVREFSKILRNDISRAQTQSQENTDLAQAEPHFSVNSESWIFPAAEREYREGINALGRYLKGLGDTGNQTTQFFSRADNLRDWLKVVASRLGSLSQRLSASVGQERINTDLVGEPEAQPSTQTDDEMNIKTPWMQIDDTFYEARGASWALIHLLRAIEIDFQQVLQKKNAVRSVQQIIRELEATQRRVWSPYVLNGSDFGFFGNYSLVMSSYISRANAALIDLRDLLSQG